MIVSVIYTSIGFFFNVFCLALIAAEVMDIY